MYQKPNSVNFSRNYILIFFFFFTLIIIGLNNLLFPLYLLVVSIWSLALLFFNVNQLLGHVFMMWACGALTSQCGINMRLYMTCKLVSHRDRICFLVI